MPDRLREAPPLAGVSVGREVREVRAVIFERLAGRLGEPGNVSMRGFFLFGLAYGAASLSCVLPAFLAVVGSSLASGGLLGGVGRFFGFALGMTALLVTLTLALALFKQGLLTWLHRVVS